MSPLRLETLIDELSHFKNIKNKKKNIALAWYAPLQFSDYIAL